MILICNIPQNFRFSFSKLELFDHCPMAFKLQYVDKVCKDTGNAFSDYGTYCHELLEQWAKGMVPEFLMGSLYADGFEAAIKHDFPPYPVGQWEKFRQQGQDYFDSFQGFGDQYEILSAEEKFTTTFAGYPFAGVADLILRDKNTGEIIVVDHKSKSKSSMENDLEVYRKQLYTYAHAVMEKYGQFPSKLVFNGFRENYWIEEEFDPVEYVKSIQWIGDTIRKILSDPEWYVSTSGFYCRYICSCFDQCPAADIILHPPKKTLTWNGVTKTVDEWSEETGVSKAAITRRMNKGMTAEEIFAVKPKKTRKKCEAQDNGSEEEAT